TRLQRDTRRAVRWLAIGGVTLSVAIAVIYGLTRGDWLNGLLAGITTAMAIVPEELPVVLTVFLGLGAWRIAQQRVLTRRIPAIEMLGAATVLCTDKTGTLTENRMSLAALWTEGEALAIPTGTDEPLPECYHALLEYATLAGHRDPFEPMEQAIVGATDGLLADTEHVHPDWHLVTEYPLTTKLKAMSRVWASVAEGRYVIASKGAPEDVIDLCHLDSDSADAVAVAAQAMASGGLRVLGVARAYFEGPSLPEIQHDFPFEFVGLVGMADPLRTGAAAAVAEAQSGGMRIIMITGDYPATAMSIAAQAGIDRSAGYLAGPELDDLDEAQLREKVRTINVFCRMVPEQKLRLVSVLKANGETVAMTGDGVNDAPALKAAHIGIAMGQRGTDVARESASLVLLDDDFTAIVAAIRLGRRIFDNLRKAVTFIIGVHVPIVGLSFIPVVLGWPLMLMPIHVMFLQLIIDPVCSIVFESEPEDVDTMRRPPRAPDASIFGPASVVLGLTQGAVLLIGVLAVDWAARARGFDPDAARALSFTTLVLGGLALVFANRSLRHGIGSILVTRNVAVWPIAFGTLGILALVLYQPVLGRAFHFGRIGFHSLLGPLAAAAASAVVFELLKRARLRQQPD
ncbi:MAG: cation-translocating P-type ATPase, partial [Betaproteobacteria bacterium]